MTSGTTLTDIHNEIEKFLTEFPQGVIVLYGPTASGKTSLSQEIAHHFPVEIISADSRQIYKGMDIGTDKISEENRKKTPHHLIDLISPDQKFTASQRKSAAEKTVEEIQARKKIPLVVGGTGLYVDTLYHNFSLPEIAPDYERRERMEKIEKEHPGFLYQELTKIDPEEAQKNHPNSSRYLLRALEIFYKTGKTKTELAQKSPVKRPLLMIGLERPKEITDKNISQRVHEMLKNGLIQEVERLLKQGYNSSLQAMNAIGYAETINHIEGKINKKQLENEIILHTVQFAKRQRTRFRRYEAESKNNPKENVKYIKL